MKNIFMSCALLFSAQLIASEQIANRSVVKISAYGTYAVVQIDTPSENSAACTRGNAGNYVAINFSGETGKEMYAMVLAARVSGQKVGFGLTGCYNWGGYTIPSAYRIDL